jgi:dihydropteroate synthase
MKNFTISRLASCEAVLRKAIEGIGAEAYALNMCHKGIGFAAKVEALSCGAANILKQDALASGADAIVARGVVNGSQASSDALIVGSVHNIRILVDRLLRQQFGLADLGRQLEQMLNSASIGETFMHSSGRMQKFSELSIKGKQLRSDVVHVMGILNITPDSFSDGGKYMAQTAALERAKQIIDEGAMFIDIGAVSTRPGHTPASNTEEIERLEPVMAAVSRLAKDNGVFLSLDSWRADVIKRYLPMVDVINDQEGMADASLAAMAVEHGCAYCIMDSTAEPVSFLYDKAIAAEAAGLKPSQIILDPGFGFGKDAQGNYKTLRRLPELVSLGYPVLAGMSRKSMIKAAVGKEPVERVYGTVAAETLAAVAGANIIRTHDVAACMDAMKVSMAFVKS